jgi:hypothetical protein
MLQLEEKLRTTPSENKHTTRGDATITNIMRTLRKVLGDKFTSLDGLKDKTKVLETLQGYAPSTRTTMLKHIYITCSVAGESDLYKEYYAIWKKGQDAINKAEDSHEMTEQQKRLMIPTKDLAAILRDDVKEVKTYPLDPDSKQLSFMLGTALLALYTLIPPRRNLDYLHLYVVSKMPEKLDNDKNYLIMKDKKMIFQNYKTADTYGRQEVAIPADLHKILQEVLKRHPNRSEKEYLFLINQNGTPVSQYGGIQNLLKRVGADTSSTAIRHSFISEKYEDLPEKEEERKKDADAMAHSMATQKKYVRKRKED